MRINEQPSQVYLTEITQDNNKGNPFDTRQNLPSKQDSVSISAEAFTLAKELYAKSKTQFAQGTEESKNAIDPNIAKQSAQNAKSRFSLADLYNSNFLLFGESDDSEGDGKTAGASSSPTQSASSANSTQAQIDALEKQIQKIQGQIEQVASSDLPEVLKESKISALEGQISALSSQIASLKATQTKESTTNASSATSKTSTPTIFSK